uniref:Titin n=1 Tax=Labrus bergylta TaxID=56723 RepID=A0A3Q3GUT0_9LABR
YPSAGVPEAPEMPTVREVYGTNALVLWTRPRDGGKPITNYILEKKETKAKRWSRATRDPLYPSTQYRVQDLVEGCEYEYRVSGLFEGNSYEFRVFSENIAGISEPSPTSDPIKATRAITKPGPPGNPKLKDWSKSYADICWTKPTRDGGSPILGYVVEIQKSGTAQWDRINKDLIKMCAHRVPGLIEGMEYRFRIRATNKVGDSEPRELSETVLAKDILVPPELTVDVSCRDSLTVRAGQIISLITRVKGRPDPEITWTKDARALSRDKRTEMNNNYPLCEFVINDAVRSDYGKYAIVAKNSSGQAQATIIVNVLDTPGACQNLKVAYATKNSCMVSWENPEDNGGTEITQYIIECRQPSQRGWTVVSNDCTKRLIKAPLTEGCEYFFRVSAENKIGAGPTIESKTPVLAVDPIEKPGEPIDFQISEIGKTFWDSIPIEATVKGKPQPDIRWTKDESTEEIKKSPRLQFESGADFSKLLVTGARRTDSGKYVVTASNSSGTCSLMSMCRLLAKVNRLYTFKYIQIYTFVCF